MKKLILLTVLCVLMVNFNLSAQEDESVIAEINYPTLEKYIQAARVNYPRKKIFEEKVERAKADVTMSSLSYLDIFNASYFYRPNERTAINLNNPYTVNGFQFGATLNLGVFLQKPYMAKKAKADLKVAKLEDEEYDRMLENEVKKRYYNYIRLLSDLKLKTQTSQDNKSAVDNLRYKFEKGEVQLEVYNASRIKASDYNSSKIQAEMDYLVAKDYLEEIIGAKLADIK